MRETSGVGRRWQPIVGWTTFWICAATGWALTAGPSDPAAQVRESVQHFLGSLKPDHRSQASFGFDSEVREDWHYIPRERPGVALKDLTPAQRKLAHALLASSLSREGLHQAERIMYLEQVLHELEDQNPIRNPDLYFVSVFGQPRGDSPWGWRFEGHHLSLNFTLDDGKIVSTSPAFFGANPAEVRSGPLKGLRVLGREEDLGRRLMQSLTGDLKRRALVSTEPPEDILTGASRVARLNGQEGVTAREMTGQQAAWLEELIEVYSKRFRAELSDSNLSRLREEGISEVRFAWAGGTDPGQPHYYRIQGPWFLIEYDNTQNNANHVHTVWRDFENDFGRDLLQEHYRRSHH